MMQSQEVSEGFQKIKYWNELILTLETNSAWKQIQATSKMTNHRNIHLAALL